MATLNFTNLDNIGEKIREARRAKGMTQVELGRVIKVAGATIQKYEKGIIKDIPLSKLIKILDKLDILNCIGIETGPADLEEVKTVQAMQSILDSFFENYCDPHGPHVTLHGKYLIIDLHTLEEKDANVITNTTFGIVNKMIFKNNNV